MPFMYGLLMEMANRARFLVFCLLLLECAPSQAINMASRVCVATECLIICFFGLVCLLLSFAWFATASAMASVSCMWQDSRKIGRFEERGFLLSFLQLLQGDLKLDDVNRFLSSPLPSEPAFLSGERCPLPYLSELGQDRRSCSSPQRRLQPLALPFCRIA